MFIRRGRLPAVPIYFLLSVVPESFGGMVTVALQRSSAFAELDRRRIQILTKSGDMDDPRVRTRELQEAGRLSSRVSIRNIWTDLLEASDDDLLALPSQKSSLEDVGAHLLASDGSDVVTRTSETGEVLQTDRYREDGTLAISDRLDVAVQGERSGRLITLFARDGRPLAQWDRLRALYHSWVDWVIGGQEAILLVDSAPTGGLFYDYRREHVTTVQVIHNHHVLQMSAGERGQLSSDVWQMFTHLDWFDAVSVLTHGQQADLVETGVLGENSFVGSNMLRELPSAPSGARDPRRGAIIGRLVRQKRLDHAVRALRLVATNGHDVRVDLYGNGPKEDSLERLVDSLDLGEHVTFRGYDPHAKDAFESASFTVLSSRYEGQPMILLEAMGAGCIPIAYDVEYGPGDIITDGVDGFLVPEGDVEALAAAIERIVSLDERHLATMRRAAIRRSKAFTAQAVTRSWGRSLRRARAWKSTAPSVRFSAARLSSCAVDSVGVHLEIDISGKGLLTPGASALVTWMGRSRDAYGRVLGTMRRTADGVRLSALIDARALQALPPKAVLDIYVDVRGEGTPIRKRIASTGIPMPSASAGIEPYTTVAGNLSFRPAAA